ncbi:MAG: hypothetical protein KR126chlam6_01452 [Candidatus Anoxychlamydiales bacterium]|nr:hypothetical protein [Candidatus Anoxychlamydiales bacterium]
MKHFYLAAIFFILTSFSFQNFNVDDLEKESILYNSEILAKNYSGNKDQWQHEYGLPHPKQICARTSVWLDSYARAIITKGKTSVIQTLADKKLWQILTDIGIEGIHTGPMKEAGGIVTGTHTPSVDGGYDRMSLKVDPNFGTKDEYLEMVKTIHSFDAAIVGDLIPGHTGLGYDFVLALMNFKDYPGLYNMVEIAEKDWSILPNVSDGEFSKNLSFVEVDKLKEKKYIVGRLQNVIFAEPGIKVTNYDATKPIIGVDGKKRRWVYLHYFKAGQPSLNWLDPTFAANRLIAGDIMQSVGVLQNDGLRLDANAYLGVEMRPGNEKAYSEGHPLSLVSTNLISMLTRKLGNFSELYGGFTYQELNLTYEDMKTMLKLGSDFSYDFITRTAYCHALISKDADFLRLNLALMRDAKINPIRFIHALQNHDEITYELPEFSINAEKEFTYKGQKYSGKDIREKIRDEDFSKILTKKTPYILPSGNGPCTTMVGLCAAALGYKDIFNMTKDQKALVKKAHLLLTFFNAIQPGVFMVSGWDLVGAYPLKPSQVKDLIKDGDNRWINRGAYDLLGDSTKDVSASNLPKAKTLYGSLPEQLSDPSSYVSILKKMLKVRKDYKINLAWPVDVLDVKNKALYIATYKLQDKSLLVVALNFSNKSIEEDIEIAQIKYARAKNIITNKKEAKKIFSNKFKVKLDGFEAKAIVF